MLKFICCQTIVKPQKLTLELLKFKESENTTARNHVELS